MAVDRRPEDMVRITTPELAEAFIQEQVAEIQAQVGSKKVLLALSGGVDSSVVAALLIRAIGQQLVCVHVNHGLLRKGEPEQVIQVFRDQMKANLIYVDATDRFLDKLAGVAEPEQKRMIIGGEFIEVFAEEARKLDGIEFLAQGTIWPDILESEKGIKAHHNAGGLPEDMKFELVEPVKILYKDEVRIVAGSWGFLTAWYTVSLFQAPDWACAVPVPLPATDWRRFGNRMRFCGKSLQRTAWREKCGSISRWCPTLSPPVSRTESAPLSGQLSSAPSTPRMP